MAQQKNTSNKKDYIFAVGRRREAVARVRMFTSQAKVKAFGKEYKKGDIAVNGQDVYEYFRFKYHKPKIQKLLLDTGIEGKFTFTVKVEGGGESGQIDAMIHGIARALDKLDTEKYRPQLKPEGYLTRDPRVRERRKVGTGGKARRKKQSPKR